MMTWAKMPSAWIEEGGLRSIRWKDFRTEGIMALRTYIAVAQRIEAPNVSGVVKATYDELCSATCLSRTSLSKGLDLLEEKDLVRRVVDKRSHYKVCNFEPKEGWAKLPARPLYDDFGEVSAFRAWHCRSKYEFHALKAYLLIVSRRDRDTNASHLTHKNFNKYAGIPKADIRASLSRLFDANLVFADHQHRVYPDFGYSINYRLKGLFPFRHGGNSSAGKFESLSEYM